MLGPRLVQHMREKLLIGEQMSNRPYKGQRVWITHIVTLPSF